MLVILIEEWLMDRELMLKEILHIKANLKIIFSKAKEINSVSCTIFKDYFKKDKSIRAL
jgi:hypothetical protein